MTFALRTGLCVVAEDTKPTPLMTKLEWGVIIAILTASANIVFSAAVVWTTVQVHERDIEILKRQSAGDVDRLARIETKLDLILTERARNLR